MLPEDKNRRAPYEEIENLTAGLLQDTKIGWRLKSHIMKIRKFNEKAYGLVTKDEKAVLDMSLAGYKNPEPKICSSDYELIVKENAELKESLENTQKELEKACMTITEMNLADFENNNKIALLKKQLLDYRTQVNLREFDLSPRTRTALNSNGIYTLKDLISVTGEEVRQMSGIGAKSFEEIQNFLKDNDYDFTHKD